MTTATPGFIPVHPKPSLPKIHYYADVFGRAFGFYSRFDRDTFVSMYDTVSILVGSKVRTRSCLPRYPFVVVCRSVSQAVQYYEDFMYVLTHGVN